LSTICPAGVYFNECAKLSRKLIAHLLLWAWLVVMNFQQILLQPSDQMSEDVSYFKLWGSQEPTLLGVDRVGDCGVNTEVTPLGSLCSNWGRSHMKIWIHVRNMQWNIPSMNKSVHKDEWWNNHAAERQLTAYRKDVKRFRLNAIITIILKYKHAEACEMNKTMWTEITYNLRECKSDEGTWQRAWQTNILTRADNDM
jgi:hypothetical protein